MKRHVQASTRRAARSTLGLVLVGALLGLLALACFGPASAPPTSVASPAAPTPAPTTPPTAASTVPATVAPTATVRPAASFPATVVDADGQSVTLSREPQRIVSLAPSNTEILFALGLGDRVVAVSDYSDYPPEAASKPKVGYTRVDIEKVLSLNPDLVLATRANRETATPQLRERGVTVVTVEPKNLDEVVESVRMVGRITGRVEAAERLADEMRARIERVTATVARAERRPRVYYELDSKLYTAGPGSFVHDLIQRAGGENIAASAASQYPQLSQEVILQSDPEVIILADVGQYGGESPESVAARPGWQTVSAVKSGRIVPINPDLTTRAGPRLVDGLEQIARALHPELFP